MTVAHLAQPLPAIFTDADWRFYFAFYDDDTDTPHAFAADDGASLVFTPKTATGVEFELTLDNGCLSFIAPHVIACTIAESATATLQPGPYTLELRRLGTDGSIDVLAVGRCHIADGLSEVTRVDGPYSPPQGSSAPNCVQVVYTESAPSLTSIDLPGDIAIMKGWNAKASATNAIATATKAAVSGQQYAVAFIKASANLPINGPALAVQIWDGPVGTGTLIFDDLTDEDGNLFCEFGAPLACTLGNAMNATVAAGGSGITIKLNVNGLTYTGLSI